MIEQQRNVKREQEAAQKRLEGTLDDNESESDDEKYAEGVAEPVQKVDAKAKDRVTVKNLVGSMPS